jgi:hypothetical protein
VAKWPKDRKMEDKKLDYFGLLLFGLFWKIWIILWDGAPSLNLIRAQCW